MIIRIQDLPAPKQGQVHKLLGVCRISTEHQNEMSLEDQYALYHEWATREYPNGFLLERISSRGSGEQLDREEYIELCTKIDSGEYDCAVAEDLGRMTRRIHAMLLCEAGEDSATRIVAINDHVDTFEEGWRQNAFFASMRHESYTEDTSRRICRSLRARFSSGQLPMRLIAGYEAVGGASMALEQDCSKNPAAIAIYDEWFDRLERGGSFEQIADWLNRIRFAVGPYVRKSEWDGTRVGQVTYNTLLKGLRVQNRRISKRLNKTGRRKSVRAPDDMVLTREIPHLAFIEPARYDRIIRIVTAANAKYRRGIAGAKDSRNGRSRRDTRWPAQHLRCGICGRKFVLGGHGRKERMMCDGVRSYQCWNAMTVDRPALANAVAEQVRRAIEELPDFDSYWTEQLQIEVEEQSSSNNDEADRLRRERVKIQREVDNLARAVAEGRSSETVFGLLQTSEAALSDLNDTIHDVDRRLAEQLVIPSVEQVQAIAESTFLSLALESREFGDTMRDLVQDFYILPYRLLDGGHIEPRGEFTLNLSRLSEIAVPDDVDCMRIRCEVDLTKSP